MERNWAYEENMFLNVTAHNYEVAFKISEFHYNALLAAAATDSFFKTMADAYKPFHDAMETTYTAWKNSGGSQKGETLTAYQLLALSAARLNGWEPAITSVYLKGTPGYLKLFPQGRRVFTNGSIDSRIAAFSTLAQGLAATPALAATQKEVQNFWQQLHDARSTQQQSMSTTGSGSDDVEAARLAMCDAMFEDLGSIMAHFAKDRGRIGGFFDLENIRHHEQAIFKRIVKAATTLFILKHTFTAADTLTLTNNSAVGLFFWLAASKMVVFDEKASIIVQPNSVATVTAASMGAPENAYLFVHNADAATGGDCTIELQ